MRDTGTMMGTILLLLLVPIALWAIGELLAHFSKSPITWELFGFSLGRPDDESKDGKLGPSPKLPDRASLHERKPLPEHRPPHSDDFVA